MATQSSYWLELLCHDTFLVLCSKIKEFRSCGGKVYQDPNFHSWPDLRLMLYHFSSLDLLGLEVYTQSEASGNYHILSQFRSSLN